MAITFKNLGNYGQLGNQMFQYSLLKAVSIKNNYEFNIPIGNYPLLQFNICKNFNNVMPNNHYEEKYFHYDEGVFDVKDGTNFNGYFQSYKYIENIRDDLIKEFTIKNNMLDNLQTIINNMKNRFDGIVSVHVRRGDYLNYPLIHPVCDISYYIKAINKISKAGRFCYFIFSDDMNWCRIVFNKEEFSHVNVGNNFRFINTGNAVNDMILMSLCDHNIICNSSFSWWGAWLNQNLNKTIIYPNKWFGINGPQDYYDLCKPEWDMIEREV